VKYVLGVVPSLLHTAAIPHSSSAMWYEDDRVMATEPIAGDNHTVPLADEDTVPLAEKEDTVPLAGNDHTVAVPDCSSV
jgi:hypothetical protein